MKTDTTKTPTSTVLVPVLKKHKLMRHGRSMSDPYSWEWNITYSAELEEDLHRIGWPMHSATTKLYFAVFDLDPEDALELSRAELGELRASVALAAAEREAVPNLSEAAPDLYEAALDAIRIFEERDITAPIARAMLRKALAKAEGKEEA